MSESFLEKRKASFADRCKAVVDKHRETGSPCRPIAFVMADGDDVVDVIECYCRICGKNVAFPWAKVSEIPEGVLACRGGA